MRRQPGHIDRLKRLGREVRIGERRIVAASLRCCIAKAVGAYVSPPLAEAQPLEHALVGAGNLIVPRDKYAALREIVDIV